MGLDGRQLGHLVTLHFSHRSNLLGLLRQRLATMLACHRQYRTHFLDLFWRSQRAVMTGMTFLPAHLALALLAPPALSRLPGQAIGGRRLGRVGGILLARRQLPFQIGDLLFSVGDLSLGVSGLLLGVGDLPFGVGNLSFALGNLSFALGYFPAEVLVLSQ